MIRFFIRGLETDSPNAVIRTGFDKYLILGAQQESTKSFILAEFRHIPFRHQLPTVLRPNIVVEVPDLATKGLRCLWVCR